MEEDKNKFTGEENPEENNPQAESFESNEPASPLEFPEEANPETCSTEPASPPQIPDELRVEQEWAEKLGMEYDPEEALKSQLPPAPPVVPTPPPAPVQPAMYVMNPGEQLPPRQTHEPMPPSYMLWAVIATICCCLPAGIVAIVFSAQVSTKYFARDYEGARKASQTAEIWIIASIVLGVIFNAIYMPLSLLTAGM